MQRALFALAYDDPKLVETVSTSTDDNVKNVTAALTNAAIEFAKVRVEIESGNLASYDLSALTDAVNKLAAIREDGKIADTLFGTAEPAAMLDLINQSQKAVVSNNGKVTYPDDKNFHGAHANGISFYNVDATFSHEFVYWHEFGHWLKNNQPQLFQEMLDAADITKAQLDEKRKSRPELTNVFGKGVRQIIDGNGNKIFRYNNRTHEIELADGRKLPTVQKSGKARLSPDTETKKALVELATVAWNDKNYNGKVSFTPSKKFRDKAQELFGHDVSTVFITADEVRHIKNEHGEDEEQRGQIDIKPENISEIYDVVNDFDSATKEKDDRKGNQNIMVVKASNGTTYILLVERGTRKALVKTFYKTRRTSQMSDAKSPNLNAQSDSVKSSKKSIPQEERDSKPKYSLDASDNENIFRRAWNKLSKALHLNGDKIVTEETKRREKLQAQEKAMADYLKEPTKDCLTFQRTSPKLILQSTDNSNALISCSTRRGGVRKIKRLT